MKESRGWGTDIRTESLLSTCFVALFLISTLRQLWTFSMMVLHKTSIPSDFTCVSCCVKMVSVYVKTETEYEDLCVVKCLLLQFVGGCNAHLSCSNVFGERIYTALYHYCVLHFYFVLHCSQVQKTCLNISFVFCGVDNSFQHVRIPTGFQLYGRILFQFESLDIFGI